MDRQTARKDRRDRLTQRKHSCHLLSGIAVLETVFTLPGLGRLMIDSIFARDYPVLQGCLLFTACIYVVINLVVDMCYPLFDPRVSVQ